MATEEVGNEDVVAKYKKLLSLARSSLESNQATIAAKDKQIHQLIAALEEEKSSKSKRGTTHGGKEDDNANTPRNLLRRVDVGQTIWILIEYEGQDDTWKEFNNEQSLDDFITRTPGVPLIKPPRCLTPTESRLIEEEAKRRVELITEEFRRYKVRAEIARKQKDVEAKQSVTSTSSSSSSVSGNSIQPIDSLSLDISNEQADELRRYKAQLQEQEAKWRIAFERAMKENEQLRTRSSETLLIAQLREQYDNIIREKNELQEKLKIYEKVLRETHGGVSGGKSLEQSYIELRDEYKEFRRRVQAIEAQRQIEDELRGNMLLQQRIGNTTFSPSSRDKDMYYHSNSGGGGTSSSGGNNSNSNSNNNHHGMASYSNDHQKMDRLKENSSDSSIMGPSWSGNNGLMESKVKYIRQMVFQYLSCKEPEVKLHIESALMAIFRFNDQEREVIEDRKKEESQDTLTSITNFLTFGAT